MINTLASVAFGAACGAITRFLVSETLNPLFSNFRLGTLAVNILGCYVIGLLVGAALGWLNDNPTMRLMLVVGFLGSFTTFSAFSLEVVNLMHNGRYAIALTTVGAHVVGSILATVLGFISASFITKVGTI